MRNASLLIAFFVATASLQGAEVRVTRGTAYVKKAQSARWAALRGKGRVAPGDSLRTGANSSARVRTKGGQFSLDARMRSTDNKAFFDWHTR